MQTVILAWRCIVRACFKNLPGSILLFSDGLNLCSAAYTVEQNQLSCGSTGTSSGNCQETETCMVRACHTPRQPLQNHHSGHLGGWATPWSAEEMLDGQHPRCGHPCPCQNCSQGPLSEKDWKRISTESPLVSPRRPIRSRD